MLTVMIVLSIMAIISVLKIAQYDKAPVKWVALFMLSVSLLFVFVTYSDIPDAYRYEARIEVEDEERRIYFAEYSQEEDVVTIEEYVVKSCNWVDFKNYIVKTEPLEIVLVNTDEFIYKDRFAKEQSGNLPQKRIIQ